MKGQPCQYLVHLCHEIVVALHDLLSFHPARANDLLCDEVRARFDDLEAAATAGQAASSTASVLSTASDVSGWAAIATEARDGEMPSWEIAPLLGTEMVVEACRARARLALDALHARLQRLRDVLNSRSAINPLCMLALNMVEVYDCVVSLDSGHSLQAHRFTHLILATGLQNVI